MPSAALFRAALLDAAVAAGQAAVRAAAERFDGRQRADSCAQRAAALVRQRAQPAKYRGQPVVPGARASLYARGCGRRGQQWRGGPATLAQPIAARSL